MAFKLPKMGGTIGTVVLGLTFGFGFVLGSILAKGTVKYIDTATGGDLIPDEFTGYGGAQSDVTYFFPDFNQRATIA